ncbi:HNH endonuclease [Undibacterium sp. LX15W]|uniref:HNH endonuclease n=1 Tax=Undibacterium flavidum TaxID=2762297 RepID=A0ABR6YHR0_9BURK|nr:HNH endonuclease [Undibacterium flavidum]
MNPASKPEGNNIIVTPIQPHVGLGIVKSENRVPSGEADGSVKFNRWRRGDPIDKPLRDGSVPDWDTVRSRYWKNRHLESQSTGEFSKENLNRMRRGVAPLDYNSSTGEFESRELHHVDPQRNGGSNGPRNLREVTPDQHRAMDKFRK